jgi:molecular chaperone GrpE
MDRVQRIPVRGLRPAGPTPPATHSAATVVPEAPPVSEDVQFELAGEAPIQKAGTPDHDAETDWHDLALRQQAEMDNYRKRQRRLAQDQIEVERQRLLGLYLPLLDDLERALAAPAGDFQGLRRGVEMAHRAALQRLRAEGVERIDAQGQPFDPGWHDAVSTVPSNGKGPASGTVVQVLEPGYRLGERLLRPARVVVAV